MKRPYYLFNGGTMSRKDNTLCFVSDTVDEKGEKKPAKYIPIETASELFVFGALDANAALFNFSTTNKPSFVRFAFCPPTDNHAA